MPSSAVSDSSHALERKKSEYMYVMINTCMQKNGDHKF